MESKPVNGSSQVPKVSPLVIKARLLKELGTKNKGDYAACIEPDSHKLIVKARTQELYDELLKRFPDLKFDEGIEIVANEDSTLELPTLRVKRNKL